jgi:O-acetyl-ADP-ribose deacetylase (regulator of RNase III)
MLPERILLVDLHEPLVRAWQQAFASHESVEAHQADFFSSNADAMVSPANSFGIMDGGLDRAIRDTLGGDLERRVRTVILERHHGEMPVGAAEIVETGHAQWPWLVIAPTMRVPELVNRTLNAYLAFRATLLAIAAYNRIEHRIRSVVVPGLGTGIGAMEPRRCAAQMRIAFDQVSKPATIPSFDTIHRTHHALRDS